MCGNEVPATTPVALTEAMLTASQKSLIGVVAAASAMTLYFSLFDIRAVAGYLAFLLVAYTGSTVAFLKGRHALALAGVGSVVLDALVLIWFRWVLPEASSGPPSHARGLLLLMIIMWAIAPLLGIGLIGAVLRPKPESPWATAHS